MAAPHKWFISPAYHHAPKPSERSVIALYAERASGWVKGQCVLGPANGFIRIYVSGRALPFGVPRKMRYGMVNSDPEQVAVSGLLQGK